MSCIPIVLVAAAISALYVVSSFAETDPSAAADLAAMRQKAEATPGAGQAIDPIIGMIRQRQERGEPDFALRFVFGPTGIRSTSNFPVDINAIEGRPRAIARGMYLSQLVGADLNNDWSVTRDEMTSVLELRDGRNNAGDLFLLGDKDRNNILTLDEMKAVVTERAAMDQPNRRNALSLTLFDFDDDGQLTRIEVDRAVRALSQ